mgnify:CR=1 FL=1
MSNTISLDELKNLKLPCLPENIESIRYRAKTQGWEFIEEVGKARGGRLKKYLIASLPVEIRTAIQQKQAEALFAEAQEAEAKLPVPRQRRNTEVMSPEALAEAEKLLNGQQRKVANARCAVCMEILYRHNVHGLKKIHAMQSFLDDLHTGKLPEPLMSNLAAANARSNDATVSIRSLKTWLPLYENARSGLERLVALAPKPTRKEQNPMDAAWLPVFQGFYAIPTKPKMAHAYEEFARWWAENRPSETLPSYSAVRNTWAKLPPIVQERGRSTGSELKKLAAYVKRDWVTNLKPLQVGIIDGHSFKAQVRHPVHGQPFKPEVTLMIDGNTRLVTGYSLGLAESSMEVMNTVRHAVGVFGVPLVIYSDNGAGETAKRLDDEVTGIFTRLGMRHETGIAGNPQGRGIIERWWKDNLIRLARNYPTFRGEGMDSGVKNLTYRKQTSAFNAQGKGKELTVEQQRHIAQVPTWKQFAEDVKAVVEAYNNRPHSELPKNPDTGKHFTPVEFFRFQTARYELVYDKLTERELQTLFMPMETRVTRRGWLELHNESYFAQELVDYHGQTLHIAYDMADASYVMVYKPDHTLICKAVLNGNTRDAFAVPMLEKEQLKRAERKIKRAEKQAALARAETNPALEHAQTWDELGSMGWKESAIEAEYVVLPKTGTNDFVLFEADM